MDSVPTLLWEEFRKGIYGADPLSQMQERELSLAFYAGIEAAFAMQDELYAPKSIGELELVVVALKRFRRENKRAAFRANLDRSTGKS